jgi:hypothetical protein
VTSAAAIGGATSFWQGFFAESATTRNFFVYNDADAKIYESQDVGVTWSDVTPAAGSAPTYPGHFFTYEGDVLFVCSARAAIKRAIASAAGTDFSNLGGSPPIAICGAQVREHVVLGAPTGDSYSVRWGAIGDHEDWPTPGTADARAKEAGTQALPQSLGIVRQVLGSEKIGIVMQEQGLTRMTYVGGSAVYAFDTFERRVGIGHTRLAFATTDGTIWRWYSDHGFFETDGYSVNALDPGRIESSVFNDLLSLPQSTLPATYAPGVYDQHRGLVIFGNHEQDYQLCYDVASRGFFWKNETNIATVFSGRMTSPTSRKTYGYTPYNINQSSRKLQMLSSDGATLALQTGYLELEPGWRVQIQKAHLLGTGVPGSLTLSYKTAASLASVDLSQSGFTAMTTVGRGEGASARADAPYVAFRVTGTGAESQLIRGIRIFYEKTSQI